MKPCGRTNVYLLSRNGWGKQHGLVAEWLGSALQKLLQRFESAPDLQQKGPAMPGLFLHLPLPPVKGNRSAQRRTEPIGCPKRPQDRRH